MGLVQKIVMQVLKDWSKQQLFENPKEVNIHKNIKIIVCSKSWYLKLQTDCQWVQYLKVGVQIFAYKEI